MPEESISEMRLLLFYYTSCPSFILTRDLSFGEFFSRGTILPEATTQQLAAFPFSFPIMNGQRFVEAWKEAMSGKGGGIPAIGSGRILSHPFMLFYLSHDKYPFQSEEG
jgi:hypothetical protein